MAEPLRVSALPIRSQQIYNPRMDTFSRELRSTQKDALASLACATRASRWVMCWADLRPGMTFKEILLAFD